GAHSAGASRAKATTEAGSLQPRRVKAVPAATAATATVGADSSRKEPTVTGVVLRDQEAKKSAKASAARVKRSWARRWPPKCLTTWMPLTNSTAAVFTAPIASAYSAIFFMEPAMARAKSSTPPATGTRATRVSRQSTAARQTSATAGTATTQARSGRVM